VEEGSYRKIMSREGGHGLRSLFVIVTNSHRVPMQTIALREEPNQYTISDDSTYGFSSFYNFFIGNANTNNSTFSFALTSSSMSESIRKDFLTSTRLFRVEKLEFFEIANETRQAVNCANMPKERFLQEIGNKPGSHLFG
jgi:hypothetical protein